jgi:acetylornithine deacetylase/succinyl-diaminopimelate desuccinylase-like protein
VPDTCTLKVETRVLPGQSLEAVADRIGHVASRVAGYPSLTPS